MIKFTLLISGAGYFQNSKPEKGDSHKGDNEEYSHIRTQRVSSTISMNRQRSCVLKNFMNEMLPRHDKRKKLCNLIDFFNEKKREEAEISHQ